MDDDIYQAWLWLGAAPLCPEIPTKVDDEVLTIKPGDNPIEIQVDKRTHRIHNKKETEDEPVICIELK